MIKVYVACSLTYAPQYFKDEVDELKRRLAGICEVLHFKGLSDDNIPRDVYIHDIEECVCKCDLLLAVCDYPSTGLGWEMAVQAELRHKPILAVAHQDAKITKLILDPSVLDYEFRRYKNLSDDVYDLTASKIKHLQLVC
jgi:hypothetical protein